MNPRRWSAVVLLASAGFSTVETSAVLLATSMLSATAAPHIQDYVENARSTKALGDVKVIALSILRLTWNVGKIGGHQRERPTLLVSEGDIPGPESPDAHPWTAPVNEGTTQTLRAHMVDNTAGYNVAAGQPFRWRGPYFEGLSADPWGSRYAANVGFLDRPGGHAVIVVSPGPNRILETPFETVGLGTSGDDVIGLIGTGR